jgi:hypothetical protein
MRMLTLAAAVAAALFGIFALIAALTTPPISDGKSDAGTEDQKAASFRQSAPAMPTPGPASTSSVSPTEPTKEAAVATLSPALSVKTCADSGIATNELMAVTGSSPLREAPSKDAKRIVNQKATDILGETQYQQIDASATVRELCRQGKWSEVQIVEPDWLSSYRGWVPSKFIRPIQKDKSGVRVYVAQDFIWDDKISKWTDTIIAGVNKVARENSQCSKVDASSAYLSGSKGTNQNPVFYVTCRDANDEPFNVFFSASDVKTGKNLAAIQPLDHAAAVEACELAARNAATHPSTVVFPKFLDLSVQEWPSGRVRAVSNFTAKNSFDLQLTYDISCLFEGQQATEILIAEAH